MSTLTYSHRDIPADAKATGAKRPGFWRRVFDGFVAAQQRRAEREIVRFLASHGGLLNDDNEREIMQRLSGGPRRSV